MKNILTIYVYNYIYVYVTYIINQNFLCEFSFYCGVGPIEFSMELNHNRPYSRNELRD